MRYHMRRADKAIKEETDLKKVIKTAKFVTIAICQDNKPYLVSLSHGYDDEKNRIYFHCANEGKKIDYFKANNLVWGQALIDYGYMDGECDHSFATVMFSGKIFLIDDFDEKWHALKTMANQLESNPEKIMEGWTRDRVENVTIGRIDIDYWSGKKSEDATI